jgi:hypothetical protein
VTLGLPMIRISVDHGTALDLDGTGRADCGSLLEAAINLATQFAARRRRTAVRSAPDHDAPTARERLASDPTARYKREL